MVARVHMIVLSLAASDGVETRLLHVGVHVVTERLASFR